MPFGSTLQPVQCEGGATNMAVDFQHLEECAGELKDVLRRISEEQAARRKLKREFTNFQEEIVSLLEASPVIYLLIDNNLHIRKANLAALSRVCCAEQELRGQHVLEFLGYSREDHRRLPGAKSLVDAINGTIELREAHTDLNISLPCLCKSAFGTCDFIVSTVPYSTDNENFALIAIHDVTVCNRASAQAAHDERIRALATLATSIANEGNNAVQIVLGNLSIARLHIDNNQELSNLLGEIEQAALRWADLCSTLASLSSEGGMNTRREMSPTKLALSAANRFRYRHGPKAKKVIVEGCKDMTSTVIVHEQGLNQAIDALLDNAKDVARKESISLSVAERELAEQELPPLPAGTYIEFTVHDDGPGIDKQDLANIFDPLYTTKPNSRGLGLSVAYAILRRHEGTVTVSSSNGNGTRVQLYVPVFDTPMSHENLPTVKQEQRPLDSKNKGRVLLMDDEPIIRAITTSMMESMGWTVTAVSDGKEAVDAYRAAKDTSSPYSAVILDLLVPSGMGGRETIRQIRSMDPNVVAIVSSGMVKDPVVTNCREFGFDGSLPKPYTFEDLEEVLKDVLTNGDKVEKLLS